MKLGLFAQDNNTLRRYSLALLGMIVVVGKAFHLNITSEDLVIVLAFLSSTILASNWREVRKSQRKPTPSPETL